MPRARRRSRRSPRLPPASAAPPAWRSGSTRTWMPAPTPRSPPAGRRTSSASPSPTPPRSTPAWRRCRASSRSASPSISAARSPAASPPSAPPMRGLASWCASCGPPACPCERVDCGGGLGIPYRDEPAPLPEALAGAIRHGSGALDLPVMLEPGRWIAGPAGRAAAPPWWCRSRARHGASWSWTPP